jgi:ATPase subunit of ABC transporter with duplicated ATPase domains
MLDVPSITFLSNYLQTYPSTVLVVSHDRAFLDEVATDIIHQHSERLDYYKGSNFSKQSISRLLPYPADHYLQRPFTPQRKSGKRLPRENTRTRWPKEPICKVGGFEFPPNP